MLGESCPAPQTTELIKYVTRQGVDETCLSYCRNFILDSDRYREKAKDQPIIVYLSGDMSATPFDEKGFPGYAEPFMTEETRLMAPLGMPLWLVLRNKL